MKSIFKKNEIKNSEILSFKYTERKKIVTYVPLSHVDKLTFELSAAGAGKIGNYSLCSFRMKGIGTFLPGDLSNPYSGKKGKLSFEEEVRLEMEFDSDNIDKITETLIKFHPYEEPAYEIYTFVKRSNIPETQFIELKKKIYLEEIFLRIKSKIHFKPIKKKIGRIILTDNEINKKTGKAAMDKNADIIISFEKNKTKIKII